MKHVEVKLHQLKDNILDLTHIVKIQVQKTKQVVFNYDADLAFEVVKNTKRIEILKIRIEYDCKDILALYNPVAIDLRLILASLKIIESLEKIGLHTKNICFTMMELNCMIYPLISEEFKLNKMLERTVKMLYSIQKAFENNDPQLAVKTYRNDKPINKNTQRSNSRAVNWINKNPEDTRNVIFVLDIISEVERIGDLIKNISDGIVFYYEAYSIKEGKFPLT